jgi:hypothetical protein
MRDATAREVFAATARARANFAGVKGRREVEYSRRR